MVKHTHEFRDPIHDFIRVSTRERSVVDSSPFQRLRDVHQLAMTYLAYSGATHRRFEHSMGVLDLAGRAFDVITRPGSEFAGLTDDLRDFLFHRDLEGDRRYWRDALRLAALCHDLGHSPFSHASEDLYPEGWGGHEKMTAELIRSPEMQALWAGNKDAPGGDVPFNVEHVVQLSVKPKYAALDGAGPVVVTTRTGILSEIIIGDAFGVDRIDYLLRDSYHLGVAYGNFDLHRLIDTMIVLPPPDQLESESSLAEDQVEEEVVADEKQIEALDVSREPSIGIDEGGLHAAEAQTVARYAMFSQVYCHPVRRVFDWHLLQFLRSSLDDGKLPVEPESHLKMSDSDILVAIRNAALDNSLAGHEHARRIHSRDHYRLLWSKNNEDLKKNAFAAEVIADAASEEFGSEAVYRDAYSKEMGVNFHVRQSNGRVVSARTLSRLIRKIPDVDVEYVFVRPDLRKQAELWLKENRDSILDRSPKSWDQDGNGGSEDEPD